MAKAKGLSLLMQTVLLLFTALVVSQLVTFTLMLSLPQPRPEVTPLSEIVAQLRTTPLSLPEGLSVKRTSALPKKPHEWMAEDPLFDSLLAKRLGTDPRNVHIWYQPEKFRYDYPRVLGRDPDQRRQYNGVPIRHGEPIFIGAVQASWFDGRVWITAASSPAPLLTPWQQRLVIYLLLQLLFLMPLAWVFARRLTRPIRGFADAASRLGRDETVENVPEEGPLELRLAGRALNHMQARIDAHVRERTAMIGAIAHDLRTPLARIAFRIEATPEPVREKILSDIEQMQGMISDTLAFVKGTAGPYRHDPIDLAVVASTVVAAFADSGARVSFFCDAADHLVEGDELALGRLLSNLIGNAVAFANKVDVRLTLEDGRSCLEVIDDGPGIEEAMLERMFEPFERGDPSRNRSTGGAGLGLAIARSIATAHGATIDLRNRKGRGLVASVTFIPR